MLVIVWCIPYLYTGDTWKLHTPCMYTLNIKRVVHITKMCVCDTHPLNTKDIVACSELNQRPAASICQTAFIMRLLTQTMTQVGVSKLIQPQFHPNFNHHIYNNTDVHHNTSKRSGMFQRQPHLLSSMNMSTKQSRRPVKTLPSDRKILLTLLRRRMDPPKTLYMNW